MEMEKAKGFKIRSDYEDSEAIDVIAESGCLCRSYSCPSVWFSTPLVWPMGLSTWRLGFLNQATRHDVILHRAVDHTSDRPFDTMAISAAVAVICGAEPP